MIGRESNISTSEIYSNIVTHAEKLNYIPKRKRSAVGRVIFKFTKAQKPQFEQLRDIVTILFEQISLPAQVASQPFLVFKIKPKQLKFTYSGKDFLNPYEHVFFLDLLLPPYYPNLTHHVKFYCFIKASSAQYLLVKF
jgi:hypothetical protein